jgi:hypothetical protein
MALPYKGNPDYRGYLNYLGSSGDTKAKTLLNYVGNDAVWGQSGIPLQGNVIKDLKGYNDTLYDQYNSLLYSGQDGSGSGGSGGASDAAARADEQAYWADQLGNVDSQLGRLGKQEQVGQKNIDSSYNSAYGRLVGDKNVTQRDYTTKKTQTTQDNITAKTGIDSSVRNRNTSLQRMLGARGAGNSSAAQILAPYAAAMEGNKQRTAVNTAFGRNIQGLDTAWGDYEQDWNTSAEDLKKQRDGQINQLRSGIASTRAGLLEQKANAEVQRRQAGGETYIQARAARTPYLSRINQLMSQIDSLGINPTFTPKTAAYRAPDLASYTYERGGAPIVGGGVNPNMQQNAGAYWTLLGNQEEERKA